MPDFGAPTRLASGYVLDDPDGDPSQGSLEPGIKIPTVRMGILVAHTSMNGYHQLRAPTGSHALEHTLAMGHGPARWPETFSITITNTATGVKVTDSTGARVVLVR